MLRRKCIFWVNFLIPQENCIWATLEFIILETHFPVFTNLETIKCFILLVLTRLDCQHKMQPFCIKRILKFGQRTISPRWRNNCSVWRLILTGTDNLPPILLSITSTRSLFSCTCSGMVWLTRATPRWTGIPSTRQFWPMSRWMPRAAPGGVEPLSRRRYSLNGFFPSHAMLSSSRMGSNT